MLTALKFDVFCVAYGIKHFDAPLARSFSSPRMHQISIYYYISFHLCKDLVAKLEKKIERFNHFTATMFILYDVYNAPTLRYYVVYTQNGSLMQARHTLVPFRLDIHHDDAVRLGFRLQYLFMRCLLPKKYKPLKFHLEEFLCVTTDESK